VLRVPLPLVERFPGNSEPEAYLRWDGADRDNVSDARAFLMTTTTRICLDMPTSARARREEYVGQWLPEPVVDTAALAPDSRTELAEDLSVALLRTLDRLSAARERRTCRDGRRFLVGVTRKHPGQWWRDDFTVRFATNNGLPGVIVEASDGAVQTTTFELEGDVIRALYVMRNPDKLRHLAAASAPHQHGSG
jgi:hypothetical protein